MAPTKGKSMAPTKGKSMAPTKGKSMAPKNPRVVAAARESSKKQFCEDSSSDDESWPCLVCAEPFSNSRPGEKWVRCMMCRLWSHEECPNGDRHYICQNCESDDED